ncbi:hypothetical protein [Nocardia sp. XZ_19_369]|uniref:hypothetical protein n=1 Tax=Nocardia sp. XZ_19_369 TaxID=2769487 RepID=UPI00189021A1|nr:hypothetical protein [Nocardia sp. XZ_19_369]
MGARNQRQQEGPEVEPGQGHTGQGHTSTAEQDSGHEDADCNAEAVLMTTTGHRHEPGFIARPVAGVSAAMSSREEQMRADFAFWAWAQDHFAYADNDYEREQLIHRANAIRARWQSSSHATEWHYLVDLTAAWRLAPALMGEFTTAATGDADLTDVERRSLCQAQHLHDTRHTKRGAETAPASTSSEDVPRPAPVDRPRPTLPTGRARVYVLDEMADVVVDVHDRTVLSRCGALTGLAAIPEHGRGVGMPHDRLHATHRSTQQPPHHTSRNTPTP